MKVMNEFANEFEIIILYSAIGILTVGMFERHEFRSTNLDVQNFLTNNKFIINHWFRCVHLFDKLTINQLVVKIKLKICYI
jgi:hypothetical protein